MEETKTIAEIKEGVIEAEQKVLFPGTHISLITFLDKEIKLRALPISISKKLHITFKPVQKKINDMNKRTQSAVVEKKNEDGSVERSIDYTKLSSTLEDKDIELDMEIAGSILECVFILATFYKLGFSKEYIDEESSLPAASAFLEAQFKIQGDNDFLLSPLAGTMNLLNQISSPVMTDFLSNVKA